MQRYNQRLVEEMKNKQTQERVRLPKIQRSEAKTRMAMFKKSLRINAAAAITPEQERERVKQVQTARAFHPPHNIWKIASRCYKDSEALLPQRHVKSSQRRYFKTAMTAKWLLSARERRSTEGRV